MTDVELTKYQASLIRELVCPNCRKELVELCKDRAHCFHCNVHYYAKLKAEDSDGHDA